MELFDSVVEHYSSHGWSFRENDVAGYDGMIAVSGGWVMHIGNFGSMTVVDVTHCTGPPQH